ncbi:MAG: NlpC/P60 family protein, partial [Actinomycetota bacterium]|nr:NlpC/P60 family protein [Actinomycetota bacterium]
DLDLVFFADANGYIAHVGIYAGNDTMIDAPHTGAFVRYDQFNPTPGAAWGDEYYTGATDPGGAFVVPASTQPAR